jgi:hypothetical protein
LESFVVQISIPADGDYDFNKSESDYDYKAALRLGKELEEFLGRQPDETKAFLGTHNMIFECVSQGETDALTMRVYDWGDERGIDLIINVVSIEY